MGDIELNSVIIENTHIDNNSVIVVESMKEVFFDVFECKIGDKTFVFEKIGELDGSPSVICNVKNKGKTFVTEAILKTGEKPGVFLNENSLQVVVEQNVISEKDEKILKEEIQQEALSKVNTKTDVTELLAETLQEYNNKKFEEKISNYTKIYENKVYEFEQKKADYLNTLHKNFNKSIENINQDIDKKLDLFFKKTDLNQKTVLESETDRLKLEISNKYKDFLKEVKDATELNKKTVDKLLSEKSDKIKSLFEEFVEKIANDNKDMLLSNNNILEKITNESTNSNTLISEKVKELESLKETVVSVDDHKQAVESTNKKLKKLLETINNQFNRVNKKVKLLSEDKNEEYNELLAAVNKKDSVEYKTILSDKINEAELAQIKEEILKEVSGNFNNEVASMRRYAQMSAGGGTNAKQYANGGTMQGDLTVTGTMKADTILATSLLSATNLNTTYELSGFEATGNITSTANLSAKDTVFGNNLIAHNSLSAAGNLYPTTVARDGEVIVADSDGNLVFGHGEKLHIQIRNDEGSDISAGTPVYSKGEIGGSERILVGISNSSDPNKMPAIGIAETTLNTTDAKDGFAILNGVYNENISGFTGLEVGHTLYVSNGAGGLSNVKPTGVDNLIQNIGTALKVGGGGTILQGMKVSAIDRTADVPNLSAKAIFYGGGSTYVQQSLSAAVLDSTGVTLQDGGITLSQGANRTIKVARATTGEDGNNLTIEAGQFELSSEGNGGDLILKGGAGDGSDGIGGDIILSPGSGDNNGTIKFDGTAFLLTGGSSAQTAFRTAIGAGTGTYSDGSIINTNQVNAYANGTLFIRGKSGPTAYPVQITGGSEDGDDGDGSDVTIQGGQSGGDSGNGGDVTIQGGTGESTNGKVILGGTDTLQIDVNSSLSMGNNSINATTGGFSSTSGNISTGGTITSTSSTARPVQNNEGNDTPIRAIERLTQAQYTALSPKNPNTLYIIV